MPQVRGFGSCCAFGGARARFRVGLRCCVEPFGSGVESGKCGRVADRRSLRTDGRGVPLDIEGAYKPLRRDEVVLRLDDGRLISMFKERLVCGRR